jgi:hypothetical protein
MSDCCVWLPEGCAFDTLDMLIEELGFSRRYES